MHRIVTAGLVMAALVAAPTLAQPPHGQCAMGKGGGMGRGSGMGKGGEMRHNTAPLSEDGLEAVGLALQDEYRAESIYKQVLEQQGDVLPFAHIVNAEQRHSAALERVYSRRGLVAPDNGWRDLEQELPGDSLQEACQVAVEAERDNVELYHELLGRDLPADVVEVFERLRTASLERHLPAFERCATGSLADASPGEMVGGCCDRCQKRAARKAGR